MSNASRCPFCVTVLPRRTLVNRLLGFASRKETCTRCGRSFGRGTGENVAHLYEKLLQDFEDRLGQEIQTLNICDRADVLIQFGLKMENAKVASVDMLMRSLAELLDRQLAGLARGCEGRLDIRRLKKGTCEVVDIDALVEDGKYTRRRLRLARIDTNGFIQADLTNHEVMSAKFVAR